LKKTIQVGTSNFKELIEENHFFVDKSLLIKEFVQNGAKVILTPRPRRFGKTLNMSMLKHFFDIENKEENKKLFKGLKIENEKEIMKMQGEYPVIFLSFKNEKYTTFEEFKYGIKSLMMDIYRDNVYLLESDKLIDQDKDKFEAILTGKADMVEIPPMVTPTVAGNLPTGGGWGFRFFPLRMIRSTIRRYNQSGAAAILYLHPREMERDGPRLPLPPLRRFATYGPRTEAEGRLRNMLENFRFQTMEQLAKSWQSA
jgi:predicted hydrocarbon binding protein